MALNPLDVICIFDGTLENAKAKLVVCIAPVEGFFFRINTKPWPIPVCVLKLPDHNFLDHDSFIECNGPLELDEYTIQDGLNRHGLIGTFDKKIVPQILDAINKNGRISEADKKIVRAALFPLLP